MLNMIAFLEKFGSNGRNPTLQEGNTIENINCLFRKWLNERTENQESGNNNYY